MSEQPIEDNTETFINPTPPKPEPTAANQEVARLPAQGINYLLIAILFLGLGVILGLNLSDDDSAGLTRIEIRDIVEEVVQENTAEQFTQLQSILLSASTGGGIDPEALSALIQAAVEEATAERIDFLDSTGPYLGSLDAPVVIVEFSDFLCQFCVRHYEQTLTPLLDDYDGLVRYVYRHFPGVGGQNAISAALAAECAEDQEQFWEYHSLLFENQSAISTNNQSALDNTLLNFASELGLDMNAFTPCYSNRVHIASIIQDSSDAQLNGARGTPAFFVNGTFVSGAQPYDVFVGLINNKLLEQGIEPPAISVEVETSG